MYQNNKDISQSLEAITRRDKVKESLDKLLASECFFCGEIMIRYIIYISTTMDKINLFLNKHDKYLYYYHFSLIDKPFIEDADFENIKQEWE